MVKEVDDILKKYRKKLGDHVDEESLGDVESFDSSSFSSEYIKFKQETLGFQRSTYENWCNLAEKIIKLEPPKKDLKLIEEAIETVHLDITPSGSAAFAALSGFVLVLIGFIIGGIFYTIFGELIISIPLMLIVLGVLGMFFLPRVPIYIATRWRLRASNQMVLCILYVVMYMRHTPNLENAIKFATQHLKEPLSLDLKKLFWDVETGKYSTVKESLDNYLIIWRKHNQEFVTSFHLIESSLFEPSESRRLTLLDKSLEVMLDGTYDKMLRYAHNLQNPITMLHMLGVILPILGLVIFPLLGSIMGGFVRWYHLMFLYNLVLPLLVFFFGITILSKRPTGYGDSEVTSSLMKKLYNPFWLCFCITFAFILVGLFPLIINFLQPGFDFYLIEPFKFLGFEQGPDGSYYGPFGVGALFLSFFIPFGLALGMSFYFKMRSQKLIDIRNETQDLEKEFGSALFQLGNRIGDGIPAEAAFSSVAESMKGTPSGDFFSIVDRNIRTFGMSLKESIFNGQKGAILSYPSALIETSMKVLVESSRKGNSIVAQSLISIASYVNRIQKVNERLKDLLAEIISSMKAQINFLAPAIAGIVVGIGAMIVNVVVGLTTNISAFTFGDSSAVEVQDQLRVITELFDITKLIPSYYFQIIVGVYIVQIVYVLTILSNGIENGSDKLAERDLLGKNLFKSTILYLIIGVIVTMLFNFLSGMVMSGLQI